MPSYRIPVWRDTSEVPFWHTIVHGTSEVLPWFTSMSWHTWNPSLGVACVSAYPGSFHGPPVHEVHLGSSNGTKVCHGTPVAPLHHVSITQHTCGLLWLSFVTRNTWCFPMAYQCDAAHLWSSFGTSARRSTSKVLPWLTSVSWHTSSPSLARHMSQQFVVLSSPARLSRYTWGPRMAWMCVSAHQLRNTGPIST